MDSDQAAMAFSPVPEPWKVEPMPEPLARTHPALAAQWHPTRNGALTPEQLVAGSKRPVWWRCPAGPDHEWLASVVNRTHRRSGCPFCAGLRVSVTNALAHRYPALAAEWHPTLNGTLTPDQVVAKSSRPVWWRCRQDPAHVWPSSPNQRTSHAWRGGCPFCAKRRATGMDFQAYGAYFPTMAAHWHPTWNGARPLDPRTLPPDAVAWWRCPIHPAEPWQAPVAGWSRSPGGCSFCVAVPVRARRSLAARFPALAAEWHPTRNGRLQPTDVAAAAGKRVWWRCAAHLAHEWAAGVASRTRGAGCPFCAHKRLSEEHSLAARFPGVAAEWHPTRNAPLTPSQVGGSWPDPVWWRCPVDAAHSWAAPIAPRVQRARPTGCPFCSGHRLSPTTTLAARHPALAAEWHSARNAPLTPAQVGSGSQQTVWWQCRQDPAHIWAARINSRTRRVQATGCPFCTGQRATAAESLAARRPALIDEWHPTRNGALTPEQVRPGSRRKVWWQCPAHPAHVWVAAVFSRAQGAGCPFCAGRRAAPDTALTARAPALAAQWHPTRNGALTPDQLTVGTERVVWWQCPTVPEHAWQASPKHRWRPGWLLGCPLCAPARPR